MAEKPFWLSRTFTYPESRRTSIAALSATRAGHALKAKAISASCVMGWVAPALVVAVCDKAGGESASCAASVSRHPYRAAGTIAGRLGMSVAGFLFIES